jgi:acetyl-CoA acetyltransferase
MVTVGTSILTSALYGDADCQGGQGGGSANVHNPNPVEVSAQQAWEATGCGPEDIDVAQAYDTMSPSELWDVEFLGLCKRGEAPHLLREGAFDINGKIPINTDGGLMSRGHPLGATALGQIYEVITQLRGEAGPRQVNGAKVGLCHAMGAGPNSSVTILKR